MLRQVGQNQRQGVIGGGAGENPRGVGDDHPRCRWMWFHPTLLVLTALTLEWKRFPRVMRWPMWQPMKSTSFWATAP